MALPSNSPDFDHTSAADLQAMSQEAFDALPFGAIRLDRNGKVVAYNRRESLIARRKPESVIGKNFFHDIAPCTDVAAFRGRLDAMPTNAPSTHVFDFEFDFPWGRRAVRIRFIVESADERWVFVTDVT